MEIITPLARGVVVLKVWLPLMNVLGLLIPVIKHVLSALFFLIGSN